MVDDLIRQIEARGYQWDVSNTARIIEARIWKWPNVVGRYRPNTLEPIEDMLKKACDEAGIELSEDN